ncbi:MAG: tRNA pseudouridine(38-40) synthase TruA [Cypionkella sp.]|nr:tRNA pseudouridine(38-40) synthase TruA [Cypionkella sp.]
MPRYAFLIEYNGAPFHGWQRQAGGQPSVQGALEAALAALDPAAPTLAGAGRTDAGVHATGQVAHVDLSRDWDTFRLMGAVNWHLSPAPVAVLACARVADDFHARFSATERRYLFRVQSRRAPEVLDKGAVWRVPYELDLPAMQAGAAHLIGKHDFTTFRSSICQAKSPVKSIDEITITQMPVVGGVETQFRLRARSFLHNQVRSIVGTLERVGAGAWPPEKVGAVLAAASRAACGPVAPPQGLYLTGVEYPADPFAP